MGQGYYKDISFSIKLNAFKLLLIFPKCNLKNERSLNFALIRMELVISKGIIRFHISVVRVTGLSDIFRFVG